MRELPPNCQAIRKVDGRLEFSPVWPSDQVHPLTEPFTDWQRPIVASVARCDWLDHAAKVRGAAGMSSDPFGVHATVRPNPEWLHAMKQADLWAKWGKNAD